MRASPLAPYYHGRGGAARRRPRWTLSGRVASFAIPDGKEKNPSEPGPDALTANARMNRNEITLDGVGLSLVCFPRDSSSGGYPQIVGITEGGPSWRCGLIFPGDSLARAAGVHLLDASPQVVSGAFASCRAGRPVLLKIVSRTGEAKSVSVSSRQVDGTDTLQRQTTGQLTPTGSLRDFEAENENLLSQTAVPLRSKAQGEALPVIATLQRFSNRNRKRPLVYSIQVWKVRIEERHYYKDLCGRILMAMRHRHVLFSFSEWRDLAEFRRERRASHREIETQITGTRFLIEKTESLQAWMLETAASRPWGLTCKGRRSAEQLEYVATTLGIREAQAQDAAAAAEEEKRAKEAAKPRVVMISALEARCLLAKDVSGFSDPYVVSVAAGHVMLQHQMISPRLPACLVWICIWYTIL